MLNYLFCCYVYIINKINIVKKNKLMASDFLILLTSCIDPHDMCNTKLQDKDLRLKQYLDALKFYLKQTNYNILLVDNSDFDYLNYLDFDIVNNRVEFLSFKGNLFDKKLGKGYGEVEIIEYALKKSKLINDCRYVIKITGRLVVENILPLCELYESKMKRRCNLVMCDIDLRFTMAQTRFFISNKDFISLFVSNFGMVINDSEGVYFEHAMALAIKYYVRIEGCSHSMFSFPIKISGVSGTTGRYYRKVNTTSFLKRFLKIFIYKIQSCIRKN